ncbi:MAG: hypothetical protein PHN64_03345 [Desulfovibrionaceae bacterium]|nr:hypothetical protein [Desulfovibrionaceae bacterium]
MYIITHEFDFDSNIMIKKNDADYKKFPFTFRLLDDDGVIYFEGCSTSCDDNKAFAPLDDTMYSDGCTSIQYYDTETNTWKTL